ncbi:Fc receptor-like protein 5 isoform X3 [Triplophysa dalaica]|uniref:Fc receptor-like protein 5 isoform X3 n=1 Tax=Triplophysa dalaica TaxID=1582913 RepID=UPI0024DF8D89|nr:Fc receptor-like protein 5 isoform X3 [Triplophysa dalaica]
MEESVYFLFMSLFVLMGLLTQTGRSHFQPVLSGPSRAYLRSRVHFHCEVPGWTSPLTYELRKDDGYLITTEVNTMVTFSLKVTEESKGKYYCRLTTGGQSNTVHLQVVIPVQGTSVTSEPDPPVIYEREPLVLRCFVSRGTHLSFMWYHNRQEVTSSSSELYRLSESTLTVDRAGEQHAGTYSCTAQNQMDDDTRYSSSRNLEVVVKKFISSPRLTFTVLCDGSDLLANISCAVERGSPPLTFLLLVDEVEIQEKQVSTLTAWFLQPVSVRGNMTAARCKAKTETQLLTSDPVNLAVVPVGGVVEVMVTYLYDADGGVTAARLRCVPGRGTFPAFSWSLNHTSLPAESDSHALAQNAQILITTHITAVTSGYYRCAVRDSFNHNSTWLESSDIHIQKTAGFRVVPMEIVALVFCGFLSMVIVGGTFCLLWNRSSGIETHRSKEVHQTDPIIDSGLPGADVCLETQSIEMKTLVVGLEV